MDKISKILDKLNDKELKQIKLILESLLSKNFQNLDIRKLKERKDIFRIRKGDFRIIYRINKEKIYILTIERRSEGTCRDL